MTPGVFVLGMARSGTSALTRMITELGLAACSEDDRRLAASYNRHGFFESRTLGRFNHLLLQRWSASGWREPRLPLGWQDEPGVRFLERPARRLFETVHPIEPWVYKDAGLNFLLPFWRRALGRSPDVVFIYRHPVAVARSLERDSDITMAGGLRIWEQHNRAALEVLEGHAVLVLRYGRLVEDPLGVAGEIAGWLRTRGYAVADEGVERAAATIDSGDRHWVPDARDDTLLSASQTALLVTLESSRGAHESWRPPGVAATATAPEDRRAAVARLLRRPRWWWWMGELIMPAPLARRAALVPSPQRWQAHP